MFDHKFVLLDDRLARAEVEGVEEVEEEPAWAEEHAEGLKEATEVNSTRPTGDHVLPHARNLSKLKYFLKQHAVLPALNPLCGVLHHDCYHDCSCISHVLDCPASRGNDARPVYTARSSAITANLFSRLNLSAKDMSKSAKVLLF